MPRNKKTRKSDNSVARQAVNRQVGPGGEKRSNVTFDLEGGQHISMVGTKNIQKGVGKLFTKIRSVRPEHFNAVKGESYKNVKSRYAAFIHNIRLAIASVKDIIGRLKNKLRSIEKEKRDANVDLSNRVSKNIAECQVKVLEYDRKMKECQRQRALWIDKRENVLAAGKAEKEQLNRKYDAKSNAYRQRIRDLERNQYDLGREQKRTVEKAEWRSAAHTAKNIAKGVGKGALTVAGGAFKVSAGLGKIEWKIIKGTGKLALSLIGIKLSGRKKKKLEAIGKRYLPYVDIKNGESLQMKSIPGTSKVDMIKIDRYGQQAFLGREDVGFKFTPSKKGRGSNQGAYYPPGRSRVVTDQSQSSANYYPSDNVTYGSTPQQSPQGPIRVNYPVYSKDGGVTKQSQLYANYPSDNVTYGSTPQQSPQGPIRVNYPVYSKDGGVTNQSQLYANYPSDNVTDTGYVQQQTVPRGTNLYNVDKGHRHSKHRSSKREKGSSGHTPSTKARSHKSRSSTRIKSSSGPSLWDLSPLIRKEEDTLNQASKDVMNLAGATRENILAIGKAIGEKVQQLDGSERQVAHGMRVLAHLMYEFTGPALNNLNTIPMIRRDLDKIIAFFDKELSNIDSFAPKDKHSRKYKDFLKERQFFVNVTKRLPIIRERLNSIDNVSSEATRKQLYSLRDGVSGLITDFFTDYDR